VSAIREAAADVPAAAVMSLRRPVIVAAVIGVIAIGVTAIFGHPMMGVLGCVGMLLGVLNTRLLQRSVVKVTSSEKPSKKALYVSSAQRLVLITVLAVALGVFVRPDGLGVFFGLAIFQLIMIVNTALPVLKGLRQQ
jgi:hypothetical protein